MIPATTIPTLTPAATAAVAGISLLFSLIYTAAAVLSLVAMWKIFIKAGQPGWASIIPVYNVIVLLRVIKRPWHWLLLMLIPLVGLVFAVIAMNDLSKSFGKSSGFTVGLLLLSPIFLPILGFGPARYIGSLGDGGVPSFGMANGPFVPASGDLYPYVPSPQHGFASQGRMAPTMQQMAPDWYADPAGRHQARWWDGQSWTSVAMDNGQQRNDPL